MTLIKSISGIRGTIGGTIGDNLDPVSIVKFATAYGIWIRKNTTKQTNKIVIGRDARISGEMVYNLVCGSLIIYATGADRTRLNNNPICTFRSRRY